MKTLLIMLIAVSAFSATTSVKIEHNALSNLNSLTKKQIGVYNVTDDTLGFRPWAGKDTGNILSIWLAKNQHAKVKNLWGDTTRLKAVYSARDTSVFQKSDSSFVGGLKASRFYFGILTGTRLNTDTIFSKKDSTKIGRVDSLTINKDIFFPVRFEDMDQFNLGAAKALSQDGFPLLVSTGNGFSQLSIGLLDSAQGLIEHGHRFAEGDTDHIHVHYLVGAKDAGATFVNWSVHYLARNVGDTITYTGTVTRQDTIAANTPALTYKYFEIAEVAMPLIKIGSMRTVLVKRITASPTTNPSVSPYILQIGIHRKVNSLGSHLELTK
jgi:hypothetical protein